MSRSQRELLVVLVFFALSAVSGGRLRAEEPYLEFLQALRDRGWHDTALLYLEDIATKPELPDLIRQVLPYEKARSLLEGSAGMRDLERKQEQLAEARKNLDQFLAANPSHPLAAEASFQFAKLLSERGRVAVAQADQPNNQGKRRDLQDQARDYFGQAQEPLQKARDQYQAQYKAFPTDLRVQDPRHKARQLALNRYLQAQMDLATLEVDRAKSYGRDDPQRAKLLAVAADEFERIHNEHRTLIGGLYAQLYQGKCFEEMDDVRKALGIYDELLGHDPRDQKTPEERDALQRLQHQARHFRLVCLNHFSRRDYQLVVNEAEQWLRENAGQRRQPVGLAIQWELARALEELAKQQPDGSAPQKRLFQQAYEAAEPIGRFSGEHREAALAMMSRVRGRSGNVRIDPKDFAEARDLAQGAMNRAEETRQAIEAARKAGQNEQAETLAAQVPQHWQDAARLFRRALELAGADTAIEDVNRVRLYLSYVYYQMGRSFDAAVLAEDIARRYPQMGLALNAANIALGAYRRAYNEAGSNADFEIQQMIRLAEFLAQNWPQSTEAEEARMLLGDLYRVRGEPEAAAQWFSLVPAGSPKYLEACQKAGMAYWDAYVKSAGSGEGGNAAAEGYRQKAQQLLESGIAKGRSALAPAQPPPMPLLTAELFLAHMAVYSSDYNRALGILVHANGQGVLQIVQAGQRPEVSRGPLGAEVYKTALATYVGLGNLNAAQQTLMRLEQLGGDRGSMTAVYRQLAEGLQRQIEQLQRTGQVQQAAQVRNTFEMFLSKLLEQDQDEKTRLNFAMLHWVASAYHALGASLAGPDGIASNTRAPQAQGYFARAAEVLERLLQRAAQDPKFVPASEAGAMHPLDSARLLLSSCKRREGSEQACRQALDLLLGEYERVDPSGRRERKSILRDTPTAQALRPQIEAAYVLQAWGEYDPQRWDQAIAGLADPGGNRAAVKPANKPQAPEPAGNGDQGGKVVWGWGRIAQMLQLSPSARKGGPHYATYFEACYNLAYCRYQRALSEKDAAKGKRLLTRAEQDILLIHRLNGELGGPEWFPRFDRLLQEVQQAQGKKPSGLKATAEVARSAR